MIANPLPDLPIGSRSIPCSAASDGVVVGKIHLQRMEMECGDASRIFSLVELHHAIDLTHDQLESFQRRIHSRIQESVAGVFRAHLAMLHDKDLLEWIEEGVRAQRPAVEVIREAYGHHIGLFSLSPVVRIREKVHDLNDIATRLIRNLLGHNQFGGGLHGKIVVTRALYPSDILRLVAQDAAGVVLVGGGPTAHINVLARSLELPLVVCEIGVASQLIEGAAVLLDGGQGLLLTAEEPAVLASYGHALTGSIEKSQPIHPITSTEDGHQIRLLANVGLLGEAQAAHDIGAEGIGLYRSEIPFLLRDELPCEEEQVAIYSHLLGLFPNGDITIRLLDLGGDKIAAYFPHDVGPNPSLGLRGIRFYLRHPEIFHTQVRAILRAGHGHNLRILTPMVSSVDCLSDVRNILMTCARHLTLEGIPHHGSPQLGAMIELPSAVLLAREIAKEADFIALGTNDLIQYILAVDRSDDRVADWYIPWHPAVLRAVKHVADVASSCGRPLSVCGEIACDSILMPILVGMGIKTFSVPPKAMRRIQALISSVSFHDSENLANLALSCSSIAEIEDLLGIPSSRLRRQGRVQAGP